MRDRESICLFVGTDSYAADLVNYVPNGSSSLLFKSSEHGQREVVKYLLERGARAQIHPVTKYSPLYIAAYNGKKDIVEILLKKFPELINMQTVEKWLPLHAACFNGHAAVLEFLLKYKFPDDILINFKDRTGCWKYELPFDINQRDLSGQSILYLACCIGNLRMVDLLLEFRVKATSTTLPPPDPEEETQERAPKPRGIGLQALLSKFQSKEEILKSNETWIKPVDLDLYCNQGSETALHVAVRNRHHAIASHILAAGAVPNLAMQNRRSSVDGETFSKSSTCLLEAAKNRDMGMIDLLLRYGARDDQNLALAAAAKTDDFLVMSKLLALKAHQDQESSVNKNAIAEMHMGRSMKGRSTVSSLTYNSMCPSTPVMINWHQTGALTVVKEQWLTECAVKQNPKLRLSPKYQPMALHAITRLDLSNNEIIQLPEVLWSLQSLKFLSLAGNKLEMLNDCSYSSPWLEEIQLQDNRLEYIPTNLFKLPLLSILDVSNNKLQNVPFALWTSTSIRDINLSLNMLSDLPTSLSMLRHESVSSLGAESQMYDSSSVNSDVGSDNASVQSDPEDSIDIEDDAKQLEEKTSQLDQIQVNHCNKWKSSLVIVEKEQLDPTIDKDECKLQNLNLSHNSFREIPLGLPCLAPHLTRLHLSYNSLSTIGPLSRYPASLKHLDLSHNQIDSWPGDLETDGNCYALQEGNPTTGSSCSTPEPRKVGRYPVRQGSRVYCPHRRHIRMENLRTLILADNLLREVCLYVSHPDNFSTPSEDLTEVGNDILTPKSKLMFSNLSMLDVSNNSLKCIPVSTSEITNLSVLNISGNEGITDLPPQMGLLSRLWNLNTR